MEPVTSSIRKFDPRQQSTAKLTGKPSYYRMHLSSDHKEEGTTTTDASFDVSGTPLVARQDLLDGHWEVFVEEWVAFIGSANRHNPQGVRKTVKLCLPDLMVATQDGTSTAAGVARRDDTVCQVPLEFEWVQEEYTVNDTYGIPVVDVISEITSSVVTIGDTRALIPYAPFSVEGTVGGMTAQTTYYIKTIDSATTFTVSTDPGGTQETLATHLSSNPSVKVVFNAPAENVWVSGVKRSVGHPVNINQEPKETHFNKVITNDAVGRVVNPQQLFQGKLRIQLKDRNHAPIGTRTYVAYNTNYYGDMTEQDRWQVTLLFVHKP